MSVIRRRECPEHGADTAITWTKQGVTRCGACTSTSINCGKELVDVEYVPVEELRGTTDSLDRLRLYAESLKTTSTPAAQKIGEDIIKILDDEKG